MKEQAKFLSAVLFFTLCLLPPELKITAGQATPPRECPAVDKGRPPLFVSFERVDDKAWDGRNYVKGELLLPYIYEGAEAPGASAEHYLRFEPQLLPGKLLR